MLFKLRAVSIAEHAQCIHSIEHRRLAGCGALLVLECIGRRQWPVDRVEQLIANCSTPILDFHAVDHFVLDDAQTGFDHYRRPRGAAPVIPGNPEMSSPRNPEPDWAAGELNAQWTGTDR